MQHLASPTMENANKVFDTAEDLGVPVIVHTGLGVPLAMPSLCIPQARHHPQLPIILAHAGYGEYSAEGSVVPSECPNVNLEPSWCPVTEVRTMIRHHGAERVLFESDHPDNVPVELAKYRAAHLSEHELAECLSGTDERLFQFAL